VKVVMQIGNMGGILCGAPFRFSPRAEHCMGMSAVDVRRWTAAEVRALPEEPGKRFECVDGELLVSPSPAVRHQLAQSLLVELLMVYSRAQAVGTVFCAPFDMELDARTLVQPDILLLPRIGGRPPRSEDEIGQSLLFIEILSPSSARFDRVVKRRRYQRYGVEYWIVDLDARLVERWLPDAPRLEVLDVTLRRQPRGAAAPLEIDLTALFAEALGPAED
jgi:Uma2 family endonuclease